MINFQKSTRTLNKMVASHIPPSYDSFCVCIRDFAKLVLNLTKEKKDLPPPPSSLEIERIYSVRINEIQIQSLSVDEEEAINEEVCFGKNIPVKFKKLCHAELAKYNIFNQTFQWNAKGQSKWDDLMISVIVKHWFYAKDNQAFQNYPIQSDLCDETTVTAILERSRQPLVAPSAHSSVGRADSKEEEEDSNKDDFVEPGDRTVNLDRGRGGRQPSLSKADPAMVQLLAGMQQQMAALTAAITNLVWPYEYRVDEFDDWWFGGDSRWIDQESDSRNYCNRKPSKNRTDKKTEDFRREDEEAEVEMKLMVKGPLRLKLDEIIKPSKEQQEQQLEWKNLDKKGDIGLRFKRQEKHKLVKDWPSLELRECYKVVGVMNGCRDLPKVASRSCNSHRKVLCTAGQIVSLEANNIQEGDISTAKDLKGLSTRELTRSWSENLPLDGSNRFRDEDDLLDDKTDGSEIDVKLMIDGCKIVNQDGKLVYDQFVKPEFPITNYLTIFCGFTAEKLVLLYLPTSSNKPRHDSEEDTRTANGTLNQFTHQERDCSIGVLHIGQIKKDPLEAENKKKRSRRSKELCYTHRYNKAHPRKEYKDSIRKGVKDKDRIRTIKGLKDKEGKIKDKDRIRIIKGLKDKDRIRIIKGLKDKERKIKE
ncbi:hypothetical protein BY996DRAFT_6535720 [Phakopsora pachyrhizi]|nr:hypothetical protein BY996DRAFT_6535720 [Phakopsora pachyrhizi]